MFILIPALLVIALAWGVAAAWLRAGHQPGVALRAAAISVAGAVLWMSVTWTAAGSGVLREWDRNPPPFAFFVLGIFLLAGIIAFSRLGTRLATLPLWALVAVQAFRFPLELAMHSMYVRGIMPEPMSYSGRNFDVVSGMTAIVVAALVVAGKAGRGLVVAWNLLGIGLLANVVLVAILATPRFRYFGDDQLNVWVTYPPFVWLPAVMVLAALVGHLVIFRALALSKSSI
jgi:hypothetical protein